MQSTFKKTVVALATVTLTSSAFALYYETGGALGGGGYEGYGAVVEMDRVEVTGQRSLMDDWRPMNSFIDYIGMPMYGRSFSDEAYGVTLPSQKEKDDAAKKARDECRAGCAADQQKENAVCELTGTQIRTAVGIGGAAIWSSRRVPIARTWLRKIGVDPEEYNPAVVVAAGLGAASEYVSACKGFAAGRYASCMNTGTCKG